MKRHLKDLFISTLVAFSLGAVLLFIFSHTNGNKISIQNPTSTQSDSAPAPKVIPTKVMLPVPYVSEVPDKVWSGPWKNACEEASITMVEKYYKGETSVSTTDAKAFMQMLFRMNGDGIMSSILLEVDSQSILIVF